MSGVLANFFGCGTRTPVDIVSFSLVKKGKGWPHKHKWVPLEQHPRGGEVSFCFWLEREERDQVEMCLDCLARRMKK